MAVWVRVVAGAVRAVTAFDVGILLDAGGVPVVGAASAAARLHGQ